MPMVIVVGRCVLGVLNFHGKAHSSARRERIKTECIAMANGAPFSGIGAGRPTAHAGHEVIHSTIHSPIPSSRG